MSLLWHYHSDKHLQMNLPVNLKYLIIRIQEITTYHLESINVLLYQ